MLHFQNWSRIASSFRSFQLQTLLGQLRSWTTTKSARVAGGVRIAYWRCIKAGKLVVVVVACDVQSTSIWQEMCESNWLFSVLLWCEMEILTDHSCCKSVLSWHRPETVQDFIDEFALAFINYYTAQIRLWLCAFPGLQIRCGFNVGGGGQLFEKC